MIYFYIGLIVLGILAPAEGGQLLKALLLVYPALRLGYGIGNGEF